MTEKTQSATKRDLLVVGGFGVAGSAIVNAGVQDPNWNVVTAGRRSGPPSALTVTAAARHITVDLLDQAAAERAFADLTVAPDLAFAAYVERPTMADSVVPNVEMLANALDALTLAGRAPKRVILIGGGKSYGPHLGPYKTPAKESDPRILGPIFYDDQEDLLRQWAERNGANWTILRPDGIVGVGVGSPMNLASGLAVYAAICKELDVPLRFPGSVGAWSALHQVTDAGILGRAAIWALGADTARNAIFNVTNGDNFRWKHLWKDIAADFDIETAEPQPMSLVEQMADKGPVWDRIVEKYALLPTPWEKIAAWPFLDGILSIPFDMVQSTVKIRRAGFGDCIDTHQSFRNQFANLRALNLIP